MERAKSMVSERLPKKDVCLRVAASLGFGTRAPRQLEGKTLEACLDEEPRQYLLMTTQILSFLDRAAPMIEDKSPNLLARLNRESRELHESAAALEFLLNASIARLPEEPAARTPESREHAPPSRELDTLDVFEGDLWLGGPYDVDRKTNNERISIPAASCSVLGGIQPKILVSCFDPDKFASGLVPRLLLSFPRERVGLWSDIEIEGSAEESWERVVNWLRTRPFLALEGTQSRYLPRVLALDDVAKLDYIAFHDQLARERSHLEDSSAKSFFSKAQVVTGRLALIHHGLALACREDHELDHQVGIESVRAGIAWGDWCLREQLRVFGLGAHEAIQRRLNATIEWIRGRGGRTTVRELQQNQKSRYRRARDARADLERLVSAGRARWEKKTCVLNESGRLRSVRSIEVREVE